MKGGREGWSSYCLQVPSWMSCKIWIGRYIRYLSGVFLILLCIETH